jgi:hypothetical protein
VLLEDFGFLGGVGTNPSSMIPMALVFVAGCLALTPVTGWRVDSDDQPEPPVSTYESDCARSDRVLMAEAAMPENTPVPPRRR